MKARGLEPKTQTQIKFRQIRVSVIICNELILKVS